MDCSLEALSTQVQYWTHIEGEKQSYKLSSDLHTYTMAYTHQNTCIHTNWTWQTRSGKSESRVWLSLCPLFPAGSLQGWLGTGMGQHLTGTLAGWRQGLSAAYLSSLDLASKLPSESPASWLGWHSPQVLSGVFGVGAEMRKKEKGWFLFNASSVLSCFGCSGWEVRLCVSREWLGGIQRWEAFM